MIGSTNCGKSSTATDVTKMDGFFNSSGNKETSFFWQYIITSPDEKAFKITEYDHAGNTGKTFDFEQNEIELVQKHIASYKIYNL
jgi:hypothetical protein